MENKKGLSIAVGLSIIGLLGLVFGTGAGLAFEGKEKGVALAGAAIVAIAGAGGLYLAVKAKTTESEFGKWKKFEYLGLGVCIAVAIFATTPTIYTANFIFSNRSLREAGESDASTINGMLSRFAELEGNRLSMTRQGLEDYVTFKPTNVSTELSEFLKFEVMNGRPGKVNRHVVNDYVTENSYLIEHGSLDEDLFGRYRQELANIRNQLSSFDIGALPVLATKFTVLSDSIGAKLTALSRNFNFGNLSLDGSGEYIYLPSESNTYSDTANRFGIEYASMFRPNLQSGMLTALFILLYLIDYLLEFRSLRVPTSRGPKISDKDGIPL